MKTLIAVIVLFAGMQSIAYADIYTFCSEKWGEDYKMRDYCVTKQQAAAEWVKFWLGDPDIVAICAYKWTKLDEVDYDMVKDCVEKQEKAKNYIDAWDGDGGILDRCTKKWTRHSYPDYNMIKFCAENQKRHLTK